MLARDIGLGESNVMVAGDGTLIEVGEERFKRGGEVDAGYVFVDGLGIGDIGSVVLRDRKHLAQDGIFVLVVSVDHSTGEVIGRPDVVTRGFVHPGTSDQLIESAKDEVLKSMAKLGRETAEPAILQEKVKEVLSKHLYERTKRRPMVVPVVMEV
jgi:ribonuclease J